MLLRRCHWLTVLLGLWVWLSVIPTASAHQSSVVYTDIQLSGRAVEVTFQLASADLYEALSLPQSRPLTREEALSNREPIAAYVGQRVLVKNHDVPCPPELQSFELADKSDGFAVVQTLRYQCPRSLENTVLTYNLFFDLDPRHQGLAHIRAFDRESEHVFRDSSRILQFDHPLTVLDNVRDYLALGIEHIFTGYDHLAFLLGLLIIAAALATSGKETQSTPQRLLPSVGLRYVVRIVTAFTLAHSVTLIVSALGWVSLPSRLVESAIAASIAYVALENIVRPAPTHRFLLTFAFGLIHGFGFASVLREIGLPSQGLLWSLLAFNLGVELGQLLVVTLAFPVLHLLALRGNRQPLRGRPLETLLVLVLLSLCALLLCRFGLPWPNVCVVVIGGPLVLLWLVPRWGYARCVRVGCSAVMLLFALLWLVERASGRSLFGGALG